MKTSPPVTIDEVMEYLRDAVLGHSVDEGLTVQVIANFIAGLRSPDDFVVPLDRATCGKHGEVRVIGRGEKAFCEACLYCVDHARGHEVLTLDEQSGSISMPELTVYPKHPINFINISATIQRKTEDPTNG